MPPQPAEQRALAERLLALHAGPAILVIASAWDAASARVFEVSGAQAIGSSSAGIANAIGYPDGERIPLLELLAANRRIVETVSIPVSTDLEKGFGPSVDAVAASCRGVLEAGAVGVNLEDSIDDSAAPLVDAQLHAEKIRAVRAMSDAYGVHLVINARTDGYLLGVGKDQSRLEDAVRRANLYREAGADCLFVPGVADAETIRTLAREIDGPLNILASAGCPSVSELQGLGVARLSQGSGPARAALALTSRIAEELLGPGTYEAIQRHTIPYEQANKIFER